MPLSDHPSDVPSLKRKRGSHSPSLSPIILPVRKPEIQDVDSSSSSDDDAIGPSLPIGALNEARSKVKAMEEQKASQDLAAAEARAKKPEREAWMLVPPSDNSLGFMPDPTKLKSRGFKTHPGSGKPNPAKGGSIDRSWTETPDEKSARLKKNALSVSGLESSSDALGSVVKKPSRREDRGSDQKETRIERKAKRAKDEETRRKVEDFNTLSLRGDALYKQVNSGPKHQAEDDPSKRAFDREKDVVGGSLSGMQKRNFVKKASDFNSRFSGGNYL